MAILRARVGSLNGSLARRPLDALHVLPQESSAGDARRVDHGGLRSGRTPQEQPPACAGVPTAIAAPAASITIARTRPSRRNINILSVSTPILTVHAGKRANTLAVHCHCLFQV